MAVKLSKHYSQPKWTGTWTTGIDGRFATSTKNDGRSYFMVSDDRWNPCAKDSPWIRMNDEGDWDLVYRGEVLSTHRYKNEAQRTAEQRLCKDCHTAATKDMYPRCDDCDNRYDAWLSAASGGHL